MLSRLTRPQALAVCALPVVALVATAAFAPLPFSLAQPGMTANVLGDNQGTAVITISGAKTRQTSGQLRMTTIEATGPDTHVAWATYSCLVRHRPGRDAARLGLSER